MRLAAFLGGVLAVLLMLRPSPGPRRSVEARRRPLGDGAGQGGACAGCAGAGRQGAAAVLISAAAGLRGRLSRWGRDPAAQMRTDASALLRQLAALLQSGRSDAQAWQDLRDHWRGREAPGAEGEHPLAQICSQVCAAEQLGLGAAAGLRRCRESPRLIAEDQVRRLLEHLIAVMTLSEQTGAPLARLVEQAAVSLDESTKLHAAVRTAAAGPKLTQLILTLLPVGGVAMGQLIGVDAVGTLLGSAVGLLCLALGAALLTGGHLWSSRLISGVTRDV